MSYVLALLLLQPAQQSVESLDAAIEASKSTFTATTDCAVAKIRDWILQKESADALAEAALSFCSDKLNPLLPALERMQPDTQQGREEAGRLMLNQRARIKDLLVPQIMDWRAELMKKKPSLFFPG